MPLPDKVAQQLYDQLNEMEAQMGSPMPPQVRASIHDDLEQHYTNMRSVQRSVRWRTVVLGVCYAAFVVGLGLSVAQAPLLRVIGPMVAGFGFGVGIAEAIRLGQFHERRRMMEQVGVEIHRVIYDE